jgi:hypothetical protein
VFENQVVMEADEKFLMIFLAGFDVAATFAVLFKNNCIFSALPVV